MKKHAARLKRVAVFDIDGTIFRSSLLIELTEGLVQEGIFPKSAEKKYAQSYRRWLDRKGTYDAYIWDVIRVYDACIKNVSHKKFFEVARKVTEFHKDRVYRYTRDLVQTLRKKNYFILAISHSPKDILDEFCKHMGFDKVYGRVFEVNAQGKFTGGVISKGLIADKAKVLERALYKEELTLQGSYGVGDSESDIAFLKMVEHPICFNPNSKLYAHAKKAGWTVVVERKDVVYELNS